MVDEPPEDEQMAGRFWADSFKWSNELMQHEKHLTAKEAKDIMDNAQKVFSRALTMREEKKHGKQS